MKPIRLLPFALAFLPLCAAAASTPPPWHGQTLLWQQTFDTLAAAPAEGDEWREALGIKWQTDGTRDHARVVPLPDAEGPGQALEVRFEKDRFSDGNGIGWFTSFSRLGLSPDRLRSATLVYRLKFEEDFDFAQGGKLPGLVGGENFGASGGNHPDGTNGWTARYMFQSSGHIILYPYLPPLPGSRYGQGKWGDALKLRRAAETGRPAAFVPGRWHQIAQHIELNTPGKNDGRLRVWLDGELVLDRADVGFRTRDELEQNGVGGIYFSAFFGGNSPDWSPSRDQRLWIDDVRLYAHVSEKP